eukprot:5646939-Pyramimonas_sp.AAC.1
MHARKTCPPGPVRGGGGEEREEEAEEEEEEEEDDPPRPGCVHAHECPCELQLINPMGNEIGPLARPSTDHAPAPLQLDE